MVDETKLTGAQKSAIVLLSMSEENATYILSMLSEAEIKETSHAMSNIGQVNPEIINKVLSQFKINMTNESSFIGDSKTTEKLLEKAIGKDKAATLLDEIKGPQGRNTWEKLGNVNEDILASYLRNEYPQTAALVLSKISGEHAAKVLSILPEQFAFEVIIRMLNLDSVKKEIIDRVENILKSEFITTISKTQKQDSYQMMAEIFNRFDRSSGTKYMGFLEGKFPDMAVKIKDLMFTFDDLESINTKGIQALMRGIDKNKLTIALKGASQNLRDLFIKNMSQRAARILIEEIESLGPVRVRDVDEAQTSIVNTAKDLMARGEIEIAEDGKDEYI